MPDYQQRVLDEKQELDEKRAKLIAFLDSGQVASLNSAARELLESQRQVMDRYSEILAQRIVMFK